MLLEGVRFIPLKQPYFPILLLDKELADEFLESENFELRNFSEMRAHFQLLVRKSAAIGLTYFGKEKTTKFEGTWDFTKRQNFPLLVRWLDICQIHMPIMILYHNVKDRYWICGRKYLESRGVNPELQNHCACSGKLQRFHYHHRWLMGQPIQFSHHRATQESLP